MAALYHAGMNLFGFLGQYPWLTYVSGALQLLCIVHAVVTKRNLYWLFILLIGGPLGVLVYLVMELLPALRGEARQVGQRVQPALEQLRPLDSRIREAQEQLAESDTLQRRADLAELLSRAGRLSEAQDTLQPLLTGLYADDPLVLLTSAQLAFARQEDAQAAQLLERVDLKTSAATRTRTLTVLAQVQARLGKAADAEQHFQQAIQGATSEEPRARYAAFLLAQGRTDDARRELAVLARTESRAGRLYKGQEREWFALAAQLRREIGKP